MILPKKWCMVFWNSLNFVGCSAIGVKDLIRLFEHEFCLPLFPVHFPETQAGKDYLIHKSEKSIEKYNKRPKAKRVNFHKIDPFLSPFIPTLTDGMSNRVVRSSASKIVCDSSNENDLVPIVISMDKNGVVEFNSSLYEWSDENVGVEEHKACETSNNETNESLCKKTYSQWRGNDSHSSNSITSSSNRKRVGFVIGGGVSLLRGRGFGLGFITLQCFMSNKRKALLIRNKGSKHLQKCHYHPLHK